MRRSWIAIAVLLLAMGAFTGAFAFARDDGGGDQAEPSPPAMVKPASGAPVPPSLRRGAPLPGLRSRSRRVVRPRIVRRPRLRRRVLRVPQTAPASPPRQPAPTPAPKAAPKPAPKPKPGKKFYDAG
jgi:hypothetical protein